MQKRVHDIKDGELLNYYHAYCEMSIWFKKIVLDSIGNNPISIKDISEQCIKERNRILLYVPPDKKRRIRKEFNAIAASYHAKVAHWTKEQNANMDMV